MFTARLPCSRLLIHTRGDRCLCVSEAIVTMRIRNDVLYIIKVAVRPHSCSDYK
ncbi:hypothetical protein C0J52_26111 [Blattella germanica]|nr:hypothetical protein C0J52_26111 [Blattella germanica]